VSAVPACCWLAASWDRGCRGCVTAGCKKDTQCSELWCELGHTSRGEVGAGVGVGEGQSSENMLAVTQPVSGFGTTASHASSNICLLLGCACGLESKF
jgi:hypothetical protein